MFNTRLWDLSMLRLNQLGYFDPIKDRGAGTDTDIRRNTREGLVDLTLKVKERDATRSISTAAFRAFAGSFIGFGYATNNFLGLGETLSFDTQLGSRERVIQFGFTEPYLFDKPIQAGFTDLIPAGSIGIRPAKSRYFRARTSSALRPARNDNLLNYRQNSAGFTTFVSYPLRKSFARLSLTTASQIERHPVQQIGGEPVPVHRFRKRFRPNSLEGITTSQITPGYFYNTVDHPISPSKGKSLFASVAIAGFGGNTNFIQPTVEAKYFKPHGGRRTIAMRGLFSFLSGYGGKVPPPFNRSYMGAENDVRGFQIWSIIPMIWIPDIATVPIVNDNGVPRTQVVEIDGVEERVPVTTEVPVYRVNFPGGDNALRLQLRISHQALRAGRPGAVLRHRLQQDSAQESGPA